jgi:ketosteroid isomerase-like protein
VAMSEENVEVVRGAINAWNRGDYEAWIDGFDSDCEFMPLRAQLEGQAYRGHDGLRQFMDDLAQDWEQVRFEVSEIREVGDKVLVLIRFQGRGRASGANLDIPIGIVGKVQQGKVTQARMFSDPDEALEAVGLSD